MVETLGALLEIWRYPVSSLAGESIKRSRVTPAGLDHDRRFAVYGTEAPEIAYPSISRKWNPAPRVAARMSDRDTVELSLDRTHWHNAHDPKVLDKLEALFETPVALLEYGDQYKGVVAERRYTMQPIHILSRQALDRLKTLIPDSAVLQKRFRPNLVLDLPDIPGLLPEYALLGRDFNVGPVQLRGIGPCGRCSFTTLEQIDMPEDRDVLRALIQNFGKNFGIYCEVLEGGEIAVGDNVAAMPLSAPRPVVIVGAGQAGATVAKSLRSLGATGPISIFGDEAHAPYERPPLSKSRSSALTHVLTSKEAATLAVDLHLNSHVTKIDPRAFEIITSDGLCHPYDSLVIATGGRPKRLARLKENGRVHVLRTAEDAACLHALIGPSSNIAVIGGGWLGMEIAAIARQQGSAVTVFVRQPRILTRSLPRDVTDIIEAKHRAEGVNLILGFEPEIEDAGNHVEVSTANGTQQFDHLLLAIGITPNDDLGHQAGLDTADGILTDIDGATSDPNIFAVGDVSSQKIPGRETPLRIESWHNANDQGERAARAILGLPAVAAPPIRFWSSQYDLMIQIAGLPDPDAVPVHKQRTVENFWDFGTFAVGINAPQEMRRFAVKLTNSLEDRPALRATTSVPIPSPTGIKILVGMAADFPEGAIRKISHAGTDIALTLQEGRIYAVSDRCPHVGASMSEGFVQDGRIVCPLHFAEFDLSTGEPSNAPSGCGYLQCYLVSVEHDHVYITL